MIVPVSIMIICGLVIIYNCLTYLTSPLKSQCHYHYQVLKEKMKTEYVSMKVIQKYYDFYRPLVPSDYLLTRYHKLIKQYAQYVGHLQ